MRRWKILVGAGVLAVGGGGLLLRALEPERRLLLAGGFSAENAELFRAMTRGGGRDSVGRYFDEVPNALPLYRAWVRAHGSGNPNVLDREVTLVALAPEPGVTRISSGVNLTETLDARDYELLRTHEGWNEDSGTDPADALLAVDFARARREILAKPPHAHALLALVHWGVPAAEVRAALPRLEIWRPPPTAMMSEETTGEERAFAARLLLEDQSLDDPLAAIRAARLPLPTPRKSDPVAPWRPYSRPVAPASLLLTGKAPIVWGNLIAMGDRLRRDPRDAGAREWFRRAMAVPYSGYRYTSREHLAQAGDTRALDSIRADLASRNGGRLRWGLDSCGSPATLPLLASLVEHPYLWVRLDAARKLGALAPVIGAKGEAALAPFRRDRARDVRRLARGLSPLGIATGTTLFSLRRRHYDGPGPSRAGELDYWTDTYPLLGPRR